MALDVMGNYMQLMSYHYILTDRDLLQKINEDYFNSKFLQNCFSVAKAFTLKYMTPPSKRELLEELGRTVEVDELTESQVETLYAQDINGIDKDYIREMVINVAMWQGVVNSHFKAGEYIKKNDVLIRENPNLAKVCREKVKTLIDEPLSIDYEEGDNSGFDFWNAESHRQDKLKRRTSGFKFLDDCMDGGYWDGCFVVFAGAPKVGKSHFLCNLCASSVLSGDNSLYITLELPEQMVIRRIGSNIFSIPHSDYEKISNNNIEMSEIIQNFRKKHLTPLGELVVKSYPTSTMTAEDLEAFVIREELKRSTENNRFKFKNVYVDYINIMRNPNNEYTENTYVKIKNISEHLKAVGVRNQWAVITATQTSKDQYNMSDMSAKDIAESSGLGATVDMMFGIIKDDTCAINNQYYIKCIYDRVAPHMEEKKLYNFDGKYLRLKEDPSSPVISCLVEKTKTFVDSVYKNATQKKSTFVGNQGNSQMIPAPNQKQGSPTPVIVNQPRLISNLTIDDNSDDDDESKNDNGNINPRLYDNEMAVGSIGFPSGIYTQSATMANDDDDDIINNKSIFGNVN